MSMTKVFLVSTFLLTAGVVRGGQLWDTQQKREVTVQDVAQTVIERQGVLLFGEVHYCAPCAQNQVDVLNALREKLGFQGQLHLAMEFIDFEKQAIVDQWHKGFIDDSQLLKELGWSADEFAFYQTQMLVPQQDRGERIFAINAPRRITRQVARGGLESLPDADKALLPPGLARGNEGYFERFREAMGHAGDPAALDRFFWAQSIWDETMAWQTLTQNPFLRKPASPQKPEVIFLQVGEFHVAYGGGLPAQLQARGLSPERMLTMSQIEIPAGLSEQERARIVEPHPRFGERARYLWLFSRD